MGKVLVYILGGQGCQEAGQLDEAIEQYDRGNEVLVLYCDKTIGGCRDNLSLCPSLCNQCVRWQKSRAKKYFGTRHIKYKALGEYLNRDIEKICENCKFSYESIQDLKNLEYKGVEIGYGLLSTYISATRNLDPKFTPKLRNYFDDVLKLEVLVTELLIAAIDDFHPTLLIVHNGRHWTYRPIIGLAKAHGIQYLCTEFIHLPDGSEGKNYYHNTIPHDKSANAHKYLSFWESIENEEYKITVGKSFFQNKLVNKYAGDTVYTKHQHQGLIPDSYDSNKHNIVIFNSSEDEMFSINKDVDRDMLFPSQISGISSIIEHYKNNDSVHIYLRIHPHLKEVPYAYHLDLYKLKAQNFSIIPADSPISSYALLDIADTVIVFGSTMGVEASYAGKKVINLACAFYDDLDVAYRPNSIETLWRCLDLECPPKQNTINAIKMGFFYMSNLHPTLKNIELKTERFKILGRHQEAHTYRTILGSSKLFWLYLLITTLLTRYLGKYNIYKLDK